MPSRLPPIQFITKVSIHDQLTRSKAKSGAAPRRNKTRKAPPVKFKMAPNSIFAILLRSPWWVSLLITLVFIGGSRAVLPDDFWVFGAMGGFPFAVITVIAGWRQLRAPSAAQVAATAQAARALGWREFSAALEKSFVRDGFTVEVLDGKAADLAVTRGGRTALVAARRWKAATHGVEGLEALHAAAQARGASECIYIALGDLSDNAQRFATRHQLRVVQDAGLAVILGNSLIKP